MEPERHLPLGVSPEQADAMRRVLRLRLELALHEATVAERNAATYRARVLHDVQTQDDLSYVEALSLSRRMGG